MIDAVFCIHHLLRAMSTHQQDVCLNYNDAYNGFVDAAMLDNRAATHFATWPCRYLHRFLALQRPCLCFTLLLNALLTFHCATTLTMGEYVEYAFVQVDHGND